MEVVSADPHPASGSGQGPSETTPRTSAPLVSVPGATPVAIATPQTLGGEVRQQEHDMGGVPDVVAIHHDHPAYE
jgi:hypothetical protein